MGSMVRYSGKCGSSLGDVGRAWQQATKKAGVSRSPPVITLVHAVGRQ
jgi:hypothetical protein